MTEQDKKRREAEQHVTDELANQAKEEPGSAGEAESKERARSSGKGTSTRQVTRAEACGVSCG